MQLERLYKTSATGATQIIDMTVNGAVYTRTWGQLDGKMQSKATTATPKNVGRSNETTAAEQSILEARAVWTKKQKANYSTSTEAPITVKLPMKVNDYHKHMKKIIFPCMTSVKLNGVNVEYRLVNGELKLLSRGGEEYPIPPHQKAEALTLLKHLNTTSINGEMYVHGEHLQDIMAATKKHNKLTPSLQFWVFDFPELQGDYGVRAQYAYNKNKEPTIHTPNFPFINVGRANSHAELVEQHEAATAAGYEGLIIRNMKGAYTYNTRSLDVFKFKTTQDAEFEVVDFKLDKNAHAVFLATVNPTPPDRKVVTFSVKLKGTAEERLHMAASAESYVGRWLKVEYEMLSKDGIPLKPVGIMFRKVNNDGEAVE